MGTRKVGSMQGRKYAKVIGCPIFIARKLDNWRHPSMGFTTAGLGTFAALLLAFEVASVASYLTSQQREGHRRVFVYCVCNTPL
jgi:hypothetical protein